jgi:hypothetical protein
MKSESQWPRWWLVVIYAAAMAWVESAVVFYLRSMIHRIEPHQPNPFPIIGGFASVELPRELATMIMLAAVGALAGRNWRTRTGYAVIAFGVWDIFYYVFLKIICDWPHTLLDWDVLFLLPLPWWGPVLAPVLISLLMILWGTVVTQVQSEKRQTNLAFACSGGCAWALNLIGVALALYVFMTDTLAAAYQGLDAIRTVLPEKFNWALFTVAMLFMSVPVLRQINGSLTCTLIEHKTASNSDEISCSRTLPN